MINNQLKSKIKSKDSKKAKCTLGFTGDEKNNKVHHQMKLFFNKSSDNLLIPSYQISHF